MCIYIHIYCISYIIILPNISSQILNKKICSNPCPNPDHACPPLMRRTQIP